MCTKVCVKLRAKRTMDVNIDEQGIEQTCLINMLYIYRPRTQERKAMISVQLGHRHTNSTWRKQFAWTRSLPNCGRGLGLNLCFLRRSKSAAWLCVKFYFDELWPLDICVCVTVTLQTSDCNTNISKHAHTSPLRMYQYPASCIWIKADPSNLITDSWNYLSNYYLLFTLILDNLGCQSSQTDTFVQVNVPLRIFESTV